MGEAQLHPGRVPSLVGVGVGEGKGRLSLSWGAPGLMEDAPDWGGLLPEGGGKAGSVRPCSPSCVREQRALCLGARQEGAGSRGPSRRRAIRILVRQPLAELLLFLFFEPLRAIYRNHLGAV